MNSSPAASPTPPPGASPASPAAPRRVAKSQRKKLRNGPIIDPETGRRSLRRVTLRTSADLDGYAASTARPFHGFRSLVSGQTLGQAVQALGQNATVCATSLWEWLRSAEGRAVLKCSLAYLVGSMATFWEPLSDFIAYRDGKHIVATLTVYFHPARTVGSMLEAMLMSVVALLYAEVVSLLAMAVPIVFRTKWDDLTIAHIIVLFVFIGGALGFVGWVKQKLNNPLSNVASTLASIAIITVITKEDAVHWGQFSAEKLVQMFKMLVIGISTTAAVNVLVWRQSARHVLRKSAVDASVSLSSMLSTITHGFLNGSEEELKSPDFARVSTKFAESHATMSSTLREVKYEQYFLGFEELYKLERTMVKAIESVSQAIGGLRSASDTQFVLLKETGLPPELSGSTTVFSPTSLSPTHVRSLPPFPKGRSQSLASIDEAAERELELERAASLSEGLAESEIPIRPFQAPSDIFEHFIASLGPSIKSFAWTLAEVLRVSPFEGGEYHVVTAKDRFRESLCDAINEYNESRGRALHNLYRSIELGRSRSEAIQADIEEVAAACGHFSFSLLQVAKEMDAFLDVLDDLKDREGSRRRSWRWLRFWVHCRPDRSDTAGDNPELQDLLPKPVQRIRKSAVPKGIPDTMVRQRDNFGWQAAPYQGGLTKWISQKAMETLRFLSRDDIRFSIKVGIGAILWASFAFVPVTKPIYMHWRGEWGLLSYMIVVSMTKGASNTTGIARFLGTLMGAAFAITGWFVGRGNALALSLIGWVVSLINFYVILVLKNAPLGRISLLCYNVTVLYAYSISQQADDDDDDDEGGASPMILEICFHRVASVTLGILWGIVVCRIIWPISGRRKFREGLAVLYLQLGLVWKRGPLTTLLFHDKIRPYMRAGEQSALQRYASKLDDLRNDAKSEFSLRGPFPVDTYARIMESTMHILDSLYSMKLVTEWQGDRLTEGERELLKFTEPERAQLTQRICHVFQVLASSLMLEYPLTDAVPSIDRTKDQLLGKIYRFRTERAALVASRTPRQTDDDGQPASWASQEQPDQQSQQRKGIEDNTGDALTQSQHLVVEEHDYALLYAYTLVTAQVAEGLTSVQRDIESLFGVLPQEALLLQ